MPQYQCPECKTVLKRTEPIPAGKKVKCPKCDHIFAAKLMAEDEAAPKGKAPPPTPAQKAAAAAPPAPAKKPYDDDDDDDVGGTYGFLDKKKDEDEEDKPEINFGSLRDKFAKSKIGPAMERTVAPSNWLLRLGLLTCIMAVAYIILGLFPIVFCEVAPVRAFIRPRVGTFIIPGLLAFFMGGVMCAGASRLHDLRSYVMAMIGAIMAILVYMPTGILIALVFALALGIFGMPLALCAMLMALVGLWCIMTLLDPKVRDGFKEREEQMKDKRLV